MPERPLISASEAYRWRNFWTMLPDLECKTARAALHGRIPALAQITGGIPWRACAKP